MRVAVDDVGGGAHFGAFGDEDAVVPEAAFGDEAGEDGLGGGVAAEGFHDAGHEVGEAGRFVIGGDRGGEGAAGGGEVDLPLDEAQDVRVLDHVVDEGRDEGGDAVEGRGGEGDVFGFEVGRCHGVDGCGVRGG